MRLIRCIKGGNWYYYKLGHDTPNIRMFSAWLRDPPDSLDLKIVILLKEEHHGRNLFDRLKSKLGV